MADRAALEALIAENRQGVLATIHADGRPQLSNILYLWDAERKLALITTTASRVHVDGGSFWTYAVADGEAEVSAKAEAPGDEICRELLPLYTALMGAPEDEGEFFAKMVAEERLIVRFRYSRLHGVIVDKGA
jgi:hypothetical protein